MVKKMEKRFKKLLTMNVVVGSVMIPGGRDANIDKMWFSVRV